MLAGLADLTATVTAVKNPNPKVVYDEYNNERYSPGDPSKRGFAYFVLNGGRFIYASLQCLLILKFFPQHVRTCWPLLHLRWNSPTNNCEVVVYKIVDHLLCYRNFICLHHCAIHVHVKQ
jgi:hypothetical protein